jgi:alanine dehydrogenase
VRHLYALAACFRVPRGRVAGRRPGRTDDAEITIFDSSGTALQDVAAAIVVFEKASAVGRGTEVKLDD